MTKRDVTTLVVRVLSLLEACGAAYQWHRDGLTLWVAVQFSPFVVVWLWPALLPQRERTTP